MTEQPRQDDSIGNVDQMVEFDYVDKELPVPLTDRERWELGADIASAQADAEKAEMDKKAADEGYKGQIEKAYATVSTIASTLRYGKKASMVQCKIKRDYRLGYISMTRMDDGTELENRPMTREERQMGMNFEEGGSKP